MNQLITCDTANVAYLLECPCEKQYDVRTTRKLKCHNNDPSGFRVMGISHKTNNWRDGNNVQIISHEEIQWIISLKTLQPCGFNIELDINCFI
ncbi:hypothetical protein XELAEV_18037309mg [Xenopus laevis]|uniref:Uncharacterized protein n=1 Tax=Xenopus laevis TaxID=8355 RepID=A0A974CCC6_XENLA|nr:hypothetical protein XELAEV_18037309mg [Xenopus laevis]